MYRTAKTLKFLDIAGQLAAILVPLGWGGSIARMGEGLFMLLFTLGGWQLLSFLIHLALRNESWVATARKSYGMLLLAVGVLGMASMVVPFVGIYVMYGLLVAGPLLGLFYLAISFQELSKLRHMSAAKH